MRNILTILIFFFTVSRISLYSFTLYLGQIDFGILSLIKIFGLGLINDLVTCLYFLVPFAFLSILIPIRIYKIKILRFLFLLFYFILIYSLCFLVVSEFTFWLEFGSRFNFIAVDYLVYTHEVIGNIRESYPIFIILPVLFIVSLTIYLFIYKKISRDLDLYQTRFPKRFINFVFILVLVLLSFRFYDNEYTNLEDNYESELNKNGLYNLFSAFRHNSIDYFTFYQTRNVNESLNSLYSFIEPEEKDPVSLSRYIKANGTKNDYNVILITIESLSSSFLDKEYHGPLTGNINNLIKESIYFNNFYATGTRTVRGLEALMLGIPPLPGQSIVRRPDNKNLFSIASVLSPENYDLKFIYGGYGYFDNMNDFFEKNGFKIVDRSSIPKDEVVFENIWGISDEDLYKQVIKQADFSYENKQKFFSFVLTTSNHRPFTYPENRINIPFSREGGVKYTDYALGEFIKVAKTKPWFKNTIFVITADHCAGTSGKIALPPEKYHIPLLIYAPNILKPQVISTITSQIDVAPTIMGLLNISYNSKFFGNDLFKKKYSNAFISTFQKLGYLEGDELIVLSPGKLVNSYKIRKDKKLEAIENSEKIVNRTIDYYQSAYYLYTKGLLKDENKE